MRRLLALSAGLFLAATLAIGQQGSWVTVNGVVQGTTGGGTVAPVTNVPFATNSAYAQVSGVASQLNPNVGVNMGGQMATNLAGFVSGPGAANAIMYFSDGIVRFFRFGAPAGTTPTPTELALWLDGNGININTNISCFVSGRYDIGSADYPLKTVYADDVKVSGSSIYMNGIKIFSIDPATSNLITTTQIVYQPTNAPAPVSYLTNGTPVVQFGTLSVTSLYAQVAYITNLYVTNIWTVYTSLWVQGDARIDGTTTSAWYRGSGYYLFDLNGTNLLNGTVGDSKIQSATTWNTGATAGTNAQQRVSVLETGKVGYAMAASIIPNASNAYDIGAVFFPIRMLYAEGLTLGTNGLQLGTNGPILDQVVMDEYSVIDSGYAAVAGKLSPTSSIIPTVSNAYDLGSVNFPFRDLYLNTNSVFMGGQKVLSYNPANTSLVSTVPIVQQTSPTNTNTVAYIPKPASISDGQTLVYDQPSGAFIPHSLVTLAEQADNFTLIPYSNGTRIKVADRIEINQMIQGFYLQSMYSQLRYGLYNTYIDTFSDSTGINASKSSGYTYYPSGKYFDNLIPSGYQQGYGLYFSGSPYTHVTFTNNGSFLPTTDIGFSVSVWVKLENKAYQTIWYLGQYPNLHWRVQWSSSNMDGTTYLGLTGWPNTPNPSVGLQPDANRWQHIVVTFTNITSGVIIYTNGVQAVAVTGGSNAFTGSDHSGLGQLDNGDYNRNYQGCMDQFAVWKRVLSPAEVLALYNDGNGVYHTDSTIFNTASAVWEMNENTGSTIVDPISGVNGDFSGMNVSWSNSAVARQAGYAHTNMTLVTSNLVLQTSPTNVRVVAMINPVSNATANTDFLIRVSRDGTNYSPLTLLYDTVGYSNVLTYSGVTNFTGPDGTNVSIMGIATNRIGTRWYGLSAAAE